MNQKLLQNSLTLDLYVIGFIRLTEIMDVNGYKKYQLRKKVSKCLKLCCSLPTCKYLQIPPSAETVSEASIITKLNANRCDHNCQIGCDPNKIVKGATPPKDSEVQD